jgi:hypothetical protein
MTLPTWQALIAVTMLYLAAFLCGLRPSRWFGSRLLPLVAIGLAAWILSAAPCTRGGWRCRSRWPSAPCCWPVLGTWCGLAITIEANCVGTSGVITILTVRGTDMHKQHSLSGSLLLGLVLAAGTAIVWGVVVFGS